MSGALSIGPILPASVTAAAPPAAYVASLSGQASVPPAAVSPSLPNPRFTVAPGLNRVVLEFFNSAGALTNSIPSQRQLDAYRLAALSGVPAGGADNAVNGGY